MLPPGASFLHLSLWGYGVPIQGYFPQCVIVAAKDWTILSSYISSRGWSMIFAIYQNSPRGTGSLFYIGRPHRQHHMSLCVLADQMTLPTHQKPSCPKCAKHYAFYALWWVMQAPSPLLFLGASYLPQKCNYALQKCNYALHECNYALQYATLHLMRNFALQYATLHYVTQLCTTLCKYAL